MNVSLIAYRKLPITKTTFRVKKAKQQKKNLKKLIWRSFKLPTWSPEKGPLNFIEMLWKTQKRELIGTLPICPTDWPKLDIGPGAIDLYRYIKTELW